MSIKRSVILGVCGLLAVVFFEPTPALAEEKDDGQEHGHGPEREKGAVRLSAEALKAAELEVSAAGPGEILETLDAPGEIQLDMDRLAHVTPRLSGVTAQVLKSVGDRVAAEELLAVLQSPDLGNAKIEYFTAAVNLELAKKDAQREKTVHDNTEKLLELLKDERDPAAIEKALNGASIGETKSKLLGAYSALRLARSVWARAEKLKEDKLISDASYDVAYKELESFRAEFNGAFEEAQFNYTLRLLQAEKALRLAEVNCQNAERRLHIYGLTDEQVARLPQEQGADVARYEVKAPFAGTVIERHVVLGEQANPERACFIVADLARVWCNLRIHVSQLPRLRVGQSVHIAVPGVDKPIVSQIVMVSSLISEKSRAGLVRVVLENPESALRPGLFVTGTVVLSQAQVPVAVAVDAVQVLENQNVVFVAGNEDGEFLPKLVKLGARDANMVEIKAGLSPGDKVVTKNSFLLKAELGKGEGGPDD